MVPVVACFPEIIRGELPPAVSERPRISKVQLPTSYISSVGPAPAKFQAAADGLVKIDQAELPPEEVKNLRELEESPGCCKVNYLNLEECLICLGCCKCKVKYDVPSFHALSVMFN